MIPYIVINGKSSRQVNGLMIQSLPPISKPLIRTEVEEIDGRDGDVVTVLGYAAYDKTISVGLHGDFNIDDVISFFSTEGKIIFSNEPDKYYNFNQYDTIDFNRLLRFRTANINIHVQPFKYSADETPISKTGNTIDMIVRNNGNIFSRPVLTLEGTGDGIVDLNGERIFELSVTDKMIIDIPNMNATDGNGNYLNRQVSGDYDSFRLIPGANDIHVEGMDKVTIDLYSRWV